jgi:antitoxin HicB
MKKAAANPHLGSTFESLLREEGTYEATTARAIKRVLARQIKQAMKDGGLSKAEMARQMDTSRAALDRLLDPNNESVTLLTLSKAAHVVGRQIRLELV